MCWLSYKTLDRVLRRKSGINGTLILEEWYQQPINILIADWFVFLKNMQTGGFFTRKSLTKVNKVPLKKRLPEKHYLICIMRKGAESSLGFRKRWGRLTINRIKFFHVSRHAIRIGLDSSTAKLLEAVSLTWYLDQKKKKKRKQSSNFLSFWLDIQNSHQATKKEKEHILRSALFFTDLGLIKKDKAMLKS